MLKKLFGLFKGEENEAGKDKAAEVETAAAPLEARVNEEPPGDGAAPPVTATGEHLEDGGSREVSLSNTSVIIECDGASGRGLEYSDKSSKKSWFSRLKERLVKTKNGFVRRIGELIGDRMAVTDEVLERLEEILVEADIGVKTTAKIIEAMRSRLDEVKVKSMDDLVGLLKEIMLTFVENKDQKLSIDSAPLSVILVVGVNGVGKTTTIGKIAANLVAKGRKTMIVAGDTFRAGAIEQAEIWARRVGIPIVKAQPNSDPAAVVFDAIQAGKARGTDVLIVDTAGRLHTKFNLMEELKKIKKVISREIEGAPHEVLQVLDGTTGQNALFQARTFNEAIGITGVVLTKLDGTAKGGIVISIADELRIPIKLIGIGEGVDDLREFNGAEFVRAIFEN